MIKTKSYFFILKNCKIFKIKKNSLLLLFPYNENSILIDSNRGLLKRAIFDNKYNTFKLNSY